MPKSSLAPVAAGSEHRAFWGLLLCVVAALGYSMVNACLRKLTIDCDRVLVIFVKELVTVAVVGPWLAWHALRGRRLLPGGTVLLALALAGLMTQLCGNLPNLWAFAVLGLAVAVPVMSGTNMVATAVLGRIFLGEHVSRQTVVAIGLVFVSILLLRFAVSDEHGIDQPQSTAAQQVESDVPTNRGPAAEKDAASDRSMATLAVLVACVVGITYAILVVVIRRNVTGDTPATAVVFMITFMGVVSLGPWLAVNDGVEVLRNTSQGDLWLMLLAGLLNLLSFLAITNGLQWTAAAHANTIMTTQVVLAAVMGAFLFGERVSSWMILGVGLTIAGMILIGRQIKVEPRVPETPETPI